MSKSVVLVLESSYEQDYGEHANIPVFNAHGEIIGWTGGDVPEYGHPCEFNALNDEGFTSCASSATVNRLRAENAKLRGLADAVNEFVEDTHCEDCPFRRDCDDNNRIFCADDFSYHAFAAMRELGIEVTNG